jgi:HEPN domain-containing protein
LCQATAEKYIKAYLISQGWQLKKVHDLAELLGFAIGYDKEFAELLPQARILDDYIEAGRYPGDLSFESIDENKAKEAIEAAEKIEQFVLEKLKSFDESA